jgi:hypothetical protein
VYDSVKKVDPTMKVSIMATPYEDRNYWATVWWLTQVLHGDKSIKFDDLLFHHYEGYINDLLVTPTDDELVGKGGRTFVHGNLQTQFNSYVQFLKSHFGNIRVFMHEFGYGNVDTIRQFNWQAQWEPFTAIKIPGMPVGRVRALMVDQAETLIPFTGMDGYFYFQMHNPGFVAYGQSYQLFANHGRATGGGNPNTNYALEQKTELYYQGLFRAKYQDRFIPDSIYTITTNGPVHVRYKHPTNDTVLHKVSRGVEDATTQVYNVLVGTNNTTAKVVTVSWNGLVMEGSETTAPVTNGYVTINNLGFTPVLVYALQPQSTPPPPAQYLKRRGGKPIRFKKS